MAVTAQKTNLQQIAWQIIQLLSASASGKLYWQSQPSQLAVQPTVQPLQPQDIAVLCRTNSQLDVIEAILLQAKIPVCRSARINVLASSMATEVAALMQLMLNPLHEGYLRRVLSGLLVGHTLADLLVLDQNPDELARLQGLFIQLAEQWHQFGFLSAWQSFSRRFDGSGLGCGGLRTFGSAGRGWRLDGRLRGLCSRHGHPQSKENTQRKLASAITGALKLQWSITTKLWRTTRLHEALSLKARCGGEHLECSPCGILGTCAGGKSRESSRGPGPEVLLSLLPMCQILYLFSQCQESAMHF